MDNEYLNLITKRATLRAEIKVKENEYIRLSGDIENLERAKRSLWSEIKGMINEAQDIADKMLEREYEALKKHDL